MLSVSIIPLTNVKSHYGGWIWIIKSLRPGDICVSRLTIIGLHNGLSPGRYQAVNWTSAGILLIGPLETVKFKPKLIHFKQNAFKHVNWKMTAILSRPQCVNKGNNVYDHETPYLIYSYDSLVNWIYIISKIRLSFSINGIMDHCLCNRYPLLNYLWWSITITDVQNSTIRITY